MFALGVHSTDQSKRLRKKSRKTPYIMTMDIAISNVVFVIAITR